MSVPLAVEGMDAIGLAQEGERLCRENNMRAGIKFLELALEKKVNVGKQSLEIVTAIYSQLGNAYFAIRNFEKALQYHQYDLETARLLMDRSNLAKAYGNLGSTYKALGNFDKAYEHAYEQLRLAQELNDKECEGRALYTIASIYHCRAKSFIRVAPVSGECPLLKLSNLNTTTQLKAAINCYTQSLKIAEEMKNLAACGRIYGSLGNSYYMLGDYDTALRYHNKRLEIARQFGDRAAMRRAYTNLANAYIFLSQPAKALDYYKLALSLSVELNDEVAEAQCCFNVGNGAAICGEHATAVEYHSRHLKLARKLGDQVGEARACAMLSVDYRSLNDHSKALYFGLVHLEIVSMLGDESSEMNAKRSIENLIRQSERWPQRRASDIAIDVSGDPQPRQLSALYSSLQSLLSNGARPPNTITSISSTIDDRHSSLASADEDFLEMLSRVQSKRINDQRCDPVILSDLTNRSKGNIARQSDSVDIETHKGKSRRISSIFGRVGKAARRRSHAVAATFLPSRTSTPRTTMTGREACSSNLGSAFDSTFTSTIISGDDFTSVDSRSLAASSLSTSSVFRIPVAPPRRRKNNKEDEQLSLNRLTVDVSDDSTMALSTTMVKRMVPQKNGAEGMLNLIASLQGRRMEEQRAHLNIGAEAETLSAAPAEEFKEEDESRPRMERSRSEEAGSLYEMVIRCQSDRINEQRSELPTSILDEDVSNIVMTMQRGRIEGQRAHLKPQESPNNGD